jgi:hypothetical protein
MDQEAIRQFIRDNLEIRMSHNSDYNGYSTVKVELLMRSVELPEYAGTGSWRRPVPELISSDYVSIKEAE